MSPQMLRWDFLPTSLQRHSIEARDPGGGGTVPMYSKMDGIELCSVPTLSAGTLQEIHTTKISKGMSMVGS